MNSSNKSNSKSIIYYLGRVLQRISLLTLVGWTIVFWVILINITVNMGMFFDAGLKFDNPQTLNDAVNKVIDTVSWRAVGSAVAAAVLTVVYGLLPRVRKYEKRLVVDSLTIIGFCFASVVLGQLLVRSFVMSMGL